MRCSSIVELRAGALDVAGVGAMVTDGSSGRTMGVGVVSGEGRKRASSSSLQVKLEEREALLTGVSAETMPERTNS